MTGRRKNAAAEKARRQIQPMMRKLIVSGAIALGLVAGSAQAADPESCKAVRFSDVGWTDIQATTGVATVILKALGYEPEVQVLSVPVTYQSLKNKDIDVFLGNWMPSMTADVQPFLDDKSVEQLTTNLEGAGYGIVVPKYVADAGVTELSQLSEHKDQFEGKIYGIEPGNDGNRIVQGMIDDPANKLEGWELVESSEQGMLAQAEKTMKDDGWIAFLGWTPHPVMGQMNLHYLGGMGDSGFGAATVLTNVRAGYASECPNVGKLLGNLKFDLGSEGAMMDAILSQGKDAETAATEWLKANPSALDAWLAGVTTFDGQDGLAAVKSSLGV
jgi:glycine betaine/proline transport system substrate-binding protein